MKARLATLRPMPTTGGCPAAIANSFPTDLPGLMFCSFTSTSDLILVFIMSVSFFLFLVRQIFICLISERINQRRRFPEMNGLFNSEVVLSNQQTKIKTNRIPSGRPT
jgi:hypothetical protein